MQQNVAMHKPIDYQAQSRAYKVHLQWNLSIEDTLNKGHLSNEDTACSPNHIDLCTNLL